jgi:hypothetical protein
LTACYNEYMSDEQGDAIYGRLCREINQLGRTVGLLESELSQTGKNLVAMGEQIQSLRFTASREAFEKDVEAMWVNIEKYKKAAIELAGKKSQKETIDHNG